MTLPGGGRRHRRFGYLLKAALACRSSLTSACRQPDAHHHLLLLQLVVVIDHHTMSVDHLVPLLATHHVTVIHWLHHLDLHILLLVVIIHLIVRNHTSSIRQNYCMLAGGVSNQTHSSMDLSLLILLSHYQHLRVLSVFLSAHADLRVVVTARAVRLERQGRLILAVGGRVLKMLLIIHT